MEFKVTKNGNITVIEVYKDGKPASPQNAVEPLELSEAASNLREESLGGEIVLISGMPTWAVGHAISSVKNLFSVMAVYMPQKNGCIVINSTSKDYKLGAIIPLP